MTTEPFAPIRLPFDQARILHVDDDIIAVNKPAGMSVHAPDLVDDLDLVTRLRLLLSNEQPAGSPPRYIAAHQPLERDCSGVVVLSRSSRANQGLAKQVAEQSMRITVELGVQCQAATSAGRTITIGLNDPRNRNRPGSDSRGLRLLVVAANGPRAIARAGPVNSTTRRLRELLSRCGEVRLEGGSDRSSGAAGRALLHVSEIEMTHPVTGNAMTFRSETGWEFADFCRDEPLGLWPAHDALRVGLMQAAIRRYALFRDLELTAFRLLHGESEGLGGLDIDRFGNWAVVWLHEQLEHRLPDVLAAVEGCCASGVYVKIRPKHASAASKSPESRWAPKAPAIGAAAPESLVVRQGKLRSVVSLGEGLGTGLFLDQRTNRQWLMSQAQGKSLVNLFAYTCSFSVAAALGGATTTSVDSSWKVLERAKQNFECNGIDLAGHHLECADVFRWIAHAATAGKRFDIIVLDPPSYSTTRDSRFVAEDDYEDLALRCVQLLGEQGGLLLGCSNHRAITSQRLHSWLRKAALRTGRTVVRSRVLLPCIDFPPDPHGEPHMKAVAVHVGSEPKSARVLESA